MTELQSSVVLESGLDCQKSPPPRPRRVCASSGETKLPPVSFCLLLQVVLNQKFTDCFVLVFLDSHLGKTVRKGGEGLSVNLVSPAPKVGAPTLPGPCFLCPSCPLSPLHHPPMFPTVSDSGFPRALPSTAPGQREPTCSAGLHLPPP